MAAAQEGRVRLLVFDNCEHVLDAVAELVDALLTRSASVRILATVGKESASPTSNCGWCRRSMWQQASTLPR